MRKRLRNGRRRRMAWLLVMALAVSSLLSVSAAEDAADETVQNGTDIILEDLDILAEATAEPDAARPASEMILDDSETADASEDVSDIIDADSQDAAETGDTGALVEENASGLLSEAASLTIESVEEVSSDEAAAASQDAKAENMEDNTEVIVEEIVDINPLYQGILDVSDLNRSRDLSDIPSAASEDVEYLDTVDAAAAVLREAMVARQETAVVYYQMAAYDSSIAKSILEAAREHTGVPDEGDYLDAHYGGSYSSISRSSSGGVYYLTITYALTYYTTAAQEQEVTAQLETVMAGLDLESKTDYEKVSAIYEYVCKHVTYDYDNLEDTSYILKYTAYAALLNGTSVCQGYAALLYRMMLMAGLDARMITGYRTSTGGGHAWNIVKLGASYYNLDATWDATETRTALVPLSYDYFLQCDANFSEHTRDDEYLTDAFYAAYPMSGTDYQPGEEEASAVLLDGTCGDGLTWEVSLGGTLTISGDGAIPDYESISEIPWAAARYGITEIVLDEGITGIGIFAFCYFTALSEIILPDSLTMIDQYAFGYCTSLTEIIIPSGVTMISYNAFNGCTALTSITFEGDVPSIYSNSFTDVAATACYPVNNDTWTEDALQDYGGTITWSGYVKHTWGAPVFNWADDYSSCSAVFTCTDEDCDETSTVDCTVSSVISAATCTEDGEAVYTASCVLGRKTYRETCTEEIVAAGHSYDEGVVTTAATCTEGGVLTYTCETCGDAYTEEIAATGHTVAEDAAVEPTCTESGWTAGSHCPVCGEVFTAQEEIMATGHTVVEDAAVEPTCTETGLTAGYHCSVCQKVLTAQEVIAATGHSYDDGVVTKEATAAEEGIRTYTCGSCGASYTESIEKLPDSSNGNEINMGGAETEETAETNSVGETAETNEANSAVGTTETNEANSAGGTAGTNDTSSAVETTETNEVNSVGGTAGTNGAGSAGGTNETNTSPATESGSDSDTSTVSATGLQISRSKIYLKVKGTAKIGVIVSPANSTDEVTYTSSKPSVVKVSASGKLTAKKTGTAKITVCAGGLTKTVTVKVVKKAVKVTKLRFQKKKLSVAAGTVRFLSYKVKNTKATTQLKWKSSNPKVVSVDQTGKITAKKKGTATITISANGKKATCRITVQ